MVGRTACQILPMVLLFVFSSVSIAAPRVRALFHESSFMTGLLIPFQAVDTVDTQSTPMDIETLELTSGADICAVMKDPFYPSIFHLKCVRSGLVDVLVRVRYQDAQYNIRYTGLNIRSVGSELPSGSGSQIDMAQYTRGSQVWVTTCSASQCHSNEQSRFRNLTVNALNTAIQSRPQMNSLSQLTTQQRTDVVYYLNNFGASP